MKKAVAIVSSTLLIAGCASRGFDRGELRVKLSTRAPKEPLEITDSAIQLALETKAQVAPPFRLGLHLDPNARFTPDEKDRIAAWGDALKKEGIVSDYFVIPEAILPGRDWDTGYYSPANLRRVRLGAARLQADVVLDMQAQTIDERSANLWSIFYPTIAGLWLAPGSRLDTLTVLGGALWDVRNEYLYGYVEAEGGGSAVRPVIFRDESLTHPDARKEALDFFEKELFTRLRHLRG